MESFDVIIIGGGPGGYVAAIRLAQLNKKVALIEKEHIGGVCLNWGCIPTKSLLKSAEILNLIKNSAEYGINISLLDINLKQIVDRSRSISTQLTTGIMSLIKKNKIQYIEGKATIIDKKISIEKDGRVKLLSAKNIIIATGARPRIIKGFEPDQNLIWTSKEAMIPKVIPKSMIIVGSGAIGIEFASFYNSMGSEVTILESQDHILPAEDIEISSLAKKMFEKKGIKFITNIKLLKPIKNAVNISVEFESNNNLTSVTAEKLLMAVGIVPNIEDMGLESLNIQYKNSFILTDEAMQTSEPNIYAIGDVTQGPWLAHKASHEGIIAAEHIGAGETVHKINKQNIPGCTYSNPQIASVGLTEQAAKLLGREIKIGKFPFLANGKALVLGEPEGLIKTIFDLKTGELIGAHMIGPEVTELIAGYVVAKNMEGTELDLINTIFAHPTLSESMHESVLAAYNRAIHI